ncbi:hypothetical protein SAMN05421594_3754 [Chryseobacterium oleae]|uniref:Uncharacterized protein n=1 Tax=Chryseobacterium oleae TaxID=491207 RepID=A0A1I5AX61_CHROL|nr:hypothetical protein SAMN05421594_3754 [Chryseobacterium oleae]
MSYELCYEGLGVVTYGFLGFVRSDVLRLRSDIYPIYSPFTCEAKLTIDVSQSQPNILNLTLNLYFFFNTSSSVASGSDICFRKTHK